MSSRGPGPPFARGRDGYQPDMAEIGYTLSSEEHPPDRLVRFAQLAEEARFDFATVSDHYHPWVDQQGHSPFVWGVLGGIAQVTEGLRVGTAVTCPTTRIHPAIIAQAAATATAMLPGRFFLGVGSGENLNEHILGRHWPPTPVRLEMLEEAVAVIRKLWQGGMQSHRGRHYTVENARIYTLPEEPPPIMVAASGPRSLELAGRIGDGLIGLAPDRDVVQSFEQSGGDGKPRYGQVHVCWAEDEAEARRTAHRWWPNAGVKGALVWELRLPSHFDQAAELVSEEDVAKSVVCGPDSNRHIEAIREFVDAGYDHVFVHQVGPDQEGFLRFYEHEVLPAVREGVTA
jgi:coenzyme F420-dependent glucose-6-phosphate dehydrogenase